MISRDTEKNIFVFHSQASVDWMECLEYLECLKTTEWQPDS